MPVTLGPTSRVVTFPWHFPSIQVTHTWARLREQSWPQERRCSVPVRIRIILVQHEPKPIQTVLVKDGNPPASALSASCDSIISSMYSPGREGRGHPTLFASFVRGVDKRRTAPPMPPRKQGGAVRLPTTKYREIAVSLVERRSAAVGALPRRWAPAPAPAR